MPTFWIGTSGWNYDDWVGRFYPADWPKRRWFEYYATQFDTVEVNATFYRTFKDQTYQKWYQQAPEHFKYVFKASRYITHIKLLRDVEENIQTFWQSASLLEDKLGLILLQLSPRMPYNLERLEIALREFPEPQKVAVELRDAQWFTADVKQLLTEIGCVLCTADSSKLNLISWVCAETGYIRLHGRVKGYRYNYSLDELKEIAAHARELATNGAQQVYIFFNNDYDARAPINALQLKELLS